MQSSGSATRPCPKFWPDRAFCGAWHAKFMSGAGDAITMYVLYISCQASCGAFKILAGSNDRIARFRAVLVEFRFGLWIFSIPSSDVFLLLPSSSLVRNKKRTFYQSMCPRHCFPCSFISNRPVWPASVSELMLPSWKNNSDEIFTDWASF